MQLFKAHLSGLTQLSLPTFPSSLRPQKYGFFLLLFCLVLSLQTYGGWRKVLPPSLSCLSWNKCTKPFLFCDNVCSLREMETGFNKKIKMQAIFLSSTCTVLLWGCLDLWELLHLHSHLLCVLPCSLIQGVSQFSKGLVIPHNLALCPSFSRYSVLIVTSAAVFRAQIYCLTHPVFHNQTVIRRATWEAKWMIYLNVYHWSV